MQMDMLSVQIVIAVSIVVQISLSPGFWWVINCANNLTKITSASNFTGEACFVCESDHDMGDIGLMTTSDCPRCSPTITLDLSPAVELFTSASHSWVAQVNSCEKLAQKWPASASYSFPTGRHEYEYRFCAARVLAGKLVGLCRRPSTAIFLHTH